MPAPPIRPTAIRRPSPKIVVVALAAGLAAALAACAAVDRSEAAVADPLTAPGSTSPPAAAAVEWGRCELGVAAMSIAHPTPWSSTGSPLRTCATFVQPDAGPDPSVIRIRVVDGDPDPAIRDLLSDGWQLVPGIGLPPGVTFSGPDAELARLVPTRGATLVFTASRDASAAPVDAETIMVMLRMAASVRPTIAATDPADPGADPAVQEPRTSVSGSRVRPDAGHVALTFDDGPHPVWTPQILDLLDEYDAPATFFVVGSAAERYPDLVREIVDRGHSVQNHTRDHVRLTQLDDDAVREQLRSTDQSITDAGAPRPRCMRPPYGVVDQRVRSLVAEQNQDVVMWTVDTLDWRNPGYEQIVEAAVSAQDRGVVLFHDGPGDRSQTVEALPWVLEFLSSNGVGFQRLCADRASR